MKRIGLDIDDVIIDFNKGFLEFYNAKYGTSYAPSDRKEYYYHPMFGVTQEDMQKEYDEYTFSHFHISTTPVGGVKDALQKLKGNQFFLISARPEKKRKVTEEWFEHHLGDLIEIHAIHLTGQHRNSVTEVKKKGAIAQELGIDIFVEDAITNAYDVASYGVPVLLFDTPWNQTDSLPPLITRVYSWNEVVEKIESQAIIN